MQNIDEQLSEEKVECLPRLAWLFLAVAFAPHLLSLAGLDPLAKIASFICFPASMGPFAVAHAYILVSRLGFTSHMAWISALTFSLTWFVLVSWLWRKNRTVTSAIGATCFLVSAGWIWLILVPPA